MDYSFDVLRGWPQGSALESNETITAAATLNAGDVVEFQADGTVNACGASSSSDVGFVVRGNGDSASVTASGDQAVIIWGNFVARTQKVDITGLAPGSRVTAKNGVLVLAIAPDDTDATAPLTFGDPIVGFVKSVHPADSINLVDSVVVVVK